MEPSHRRTRRPSRALAGWLIFAALLASGPALAEPRFLSVLDEVPLMSGLVEDAAIAFDAPGGRIVEVRAHGALEPARVVAFYARALPALGWRRVAAATGEIMRWRRGDELLRLELEQADTPVAVRFFLTPD